MEINGIYRTRERIYQSAIAFGPRAQRFRLANTAQTKSSPVLQLLFISNHSKGEAPAPCPLVSLSSPVSPPAVNLPGQTPRRQPARSLLPRTLRVSGLSLFLNPIIFPIALSTPTPPRLYPHGVLGRYTTSPPRLFSPHRRSNARHNLPLIPQILRRSRRRRPAYPSRLAQPPKAGRHARRRRNHLY
jgi:hypothetical protein